MSQATQKTYNQRLMFHCLLVIAVLCWSICPAVLGQLLHRRVDPSFLEEDLTFDTNTIPLVDNGGAALADLNFSPNVVFRLIPGRPLSAIQAPIRCSCSTP